MIDGVDHKICNRCEEWFPATKDYFYKNKLNGVDGLFPYCKKCNIEKSIQHIYNNYDDFKAYLRDYDKQSWVRKQKTERQRTYVKNGGFRAWQGNNRDKISEYAKKHQTHNITEYEWSMCKRYFNYKCAYCGLDVQKAKDIYNNYLHKEHVQHDGLNDLSNCVPACKQCNSEKGTFLLDEWYTEDNYKYNADRHNKVIKWLDTDYKKYLEDTIREISS